MLSKEGTRLLERPHPMTGDTPLYTASRWNRLKMVKLLLKAGARVRPGPFLVGVGAALALLRGYRWQG